MLRLLSNTYIFVAGFLTYKYLLDQNVLELNKNSNVIDDNDDES